MNRDATIWRRLAVYLPGLLFAAFLQTLPGSTGRLVSPDFLILFPLIAGLWTGGYDGFAFGLAAGFLRDYMAGRGYGVGMLAGMFVGLIAGRLAAEGWQRYALRGGILVLVTTFIYDMTMSFFVWLIPMGDVRTPLGPLWRVALSHFPAKLLSNIIGALALTCYFWLAFYRRKTKREKNDRLEEMRGGESLA
ncbi:MAG TPA: hypothetical protein GX728_06555 [Clostridiaceae bacterium]|nr:hypothetical protein [Clostridiaceae bacterium]